MAWDPSRPVPWQRLAKEWLVIGVVVAAMAWFLTDNRKPGSYVAIVFAGVVYVLFGAILAKFGYSRKTLKDIRAEAAAAPPRPTKGATTEMKAKPAPTKRTSTGPSNRPPKKRR